MKTSLLIAFASVIFTGCGSKEHINTVALKAAAAHTSLRSAAEAEASVPPPLGADNKNTAMPVEPVVAPKVFMTAEDSESILQRDERAQNELNQALRAYQKSRGAVPGDVRELVAAKLIACVPVPPQGGRYIIDADSQAIVWTRQ